MSEFLKASLIGDYGIDSKRVEVVGAGPSIAPVQSGTLTRRPESAFLFVGTDFTRKGGLQLLTAFQEVRRLNPSAELWLVGGYKLRSAPPGVRCFGWLDRAELEQLYSRACCFVMPTLRERFGLAFLEAMSFGLPCIGTNTQAIPEIIVEGVTGFLVPSGDTSALAEKMTRILEDPDAAEAMGKAGLRRVSTEFGWSRVADAIIRGLSLKPASVGGLAH
jgi:glycosyltransferase involved in cell wall biosynthesis